MVYILSAPIQSGKTTSLINWSAARKDVYGILTPVINRKRVFMNAQTREQFTMEATGEEESLTVGRFIFSKIGFNKAIKIIRDAISIDGWLVIDEIGPLELKGEGFYEVLKDVLAIRREKILLVVREGLTGEVKKVFALPHMSCISSVADL